MILFLFLKQYAAFFPLFEGKIYIVPREFSVDKEKRKKWHSQ